MTKRLLATAALLIGGLGIAACASTIVGDSHSGKDARARGARPIRFDAVAAEGHARDIVTYPGGDRVDWKMVELPAGKTGTLEIDVRWQTPRPGLDLAFDVYDAYFERVGSAAPTPGAGRRSKKVQVHDASGKMFLMLYAPERGDAAAYRVAVGFRERSAGARLDPPGLVGAIGDPPPLPAIPDDEPAPDCAQTPGADGCPPIPPPPPLDCAKTPTAAGCAAPIDCAKTPDDPTCPHASVKGRVHDAKNKTGGAVVVINRGSSSGVQKGWKGQLVDAKGKPIASGSFTCTKVTAAECIGSVTLTRDQAANRDAVLSPP